MMKKYATLTHIIRTLTALGILILMGVIASAFYQEYGKNQTPCPLCFLQRLCMMGVGTAAMLNLQFGVRIKHYVLALISACLGATISARQILLHICPGDPKFGYPVFGWGLYTWAFLVFCCSIVGLLILLFLFHPEQKEKHPKNLLEKCAYASLVIITLANCFTVLQVCQFGPCPDPPWPPVQKEQVEKA